MGSGTEYPLLDKWCQNTRPTNVLLLKSLPKLEYDSLLCLCDIGLVFLDGRFTIPNFPSRLLSYLEQKMPVIAATDRSTDIGNILEQNGCGYWLETGDINRFNELIEKLIYTPGLAENMGKQSWQLLQDQYIVSISSAIILKNFDDV